MTAFGPLRVQKEMGTFSTKPMMVPQPSVNRTACKLRLQVRSGLRPLPAGYVER